MSHLSDLINSAVSKALNKDGFEPRLIAPQVWAELDDESRATVGIAEIIRRMKRSAQVLTQNAFVTSESEQIELPFKIDGAVSMDVDGRKIRLTESLQEIEYNRAIEIRREQISHDRTQLREWESGAKVARPYWKKHPNWTFGQCVRAFEADLRKVNAA